MARSTVPGDGKEEATGAATRRLERWAGHPWVAVVVALEDPSRFVHVGPFGSRAEASSWLQATLVEPGRFGRLLPFRARVLRLGTSHRAEVCLEEP